MGPKGPASRQAGGASVGKKRYTGNKKLTVEEVEFADEEKQLHFDFWAEKAHYGYIAGPCCQYSQMTPNRWRLEKP